jgi:hypothetical protein
LRKDTIFSIDRVITHEQKTGSENTLCNNIQVAPTYNLLGFLFCCAERGGMLIMHKSLTNIYLFLVDTDNSMMLKLKK